MIAIVDCGSNIASVIYALKRLNKEAVLTRDKDFIRSASHVIFPGVGAAENAMRKLQEWDLVDTLRNLTQPVLGICLGMQLLYDYSMEGNVECLGIIPGKINKMLPQPGFAIPHMGWNTLRIMNDSRLLKNILPESYAYFVHSYMAEISEYTCAMTSYQSEFSAVVQYKNFYATQFHPEKSGDIGLQILNNFVEL